MLYYFLSISGVNSRVLATGGASSNKAILQVHFHLFVCLFVRLFIRLFVCSFICLFVHSFIHSLNDLLFGSLSDLLID